MVFACGMCVRWRGVNKLDLHRKLGGRPSCPRREDANEHHLMVGARLGRSIGRLDAACLRKDDAGERIKAVVDRESRGGSVCIREARQMAHSRS